MQMTYQNRDSEVIFTIDTVAMKLTALDVTAVEGVLTVQLQNEEEIVSVTPYPIGVHHVDFDPPTVDAYLNGRNEIRVAHSIAWPTPENGLSQLVE